MKKLGKLALAMVVLAGSLAVGAPAKPAYAAGYCQDICCDPWCTSVRRCFRFGGGCICEDACSIGIGPEIE